MTFRARLALLFAVVVTVLLVASGAALVSLSRVVTLQSVDRELAMRGQNVRDFGPPPGQNGPPPALRDGPDDGENLPRRRRPPLGGLAPRMFPPAGVTGETPPEPFDPAALAAISPRTQHFSTVDYDGAKVRVLTLGFEDGGRAQIAYNLVDVDRLATTQTRLLLLVIPVAVLITALIAWFLADQAVRPVERVTQAASEITGEGLGADAVGTRIPVSGDDEIAALARQFNLMLGRLESTFQQRETLLRQLQEALDAQRAFVADASHELRTPLARMKLLSSSALHQGGDADGLRDALTKVDKGADDMALLVQQLLTLARHDVTAHDTSHHSDLREVVDRAMALAEAIPGPEIDCPMPPGKLVLGKVEDLARALANVLENAKRYAPESPTIVVSFGESPGYQKIVVTDKGPGVSAEHLPNLTKRFFRADASRTRSSGGTGLGLAIVKAVVESAGGHLEIESEVGEGMTVTLSLANADQGPTK